MGFRYYERISSTVESRARALEDSRVYSKCGEAQLPARNTKLWQSLRYDDEGTDGQPSPVAAIGPQGERVWPISVVDSTRRREEKIIDCRTVTYLVATARHRH